MHLELARRVSATVRSQPLRVRLSPCRLALLAGAYLHPARLEMRAASEGCAVLELSWRIFTALSRCLPDAICGCAPRREPLPLSAARGVIQQCGSLLSRVRAAASWIVTGIASHTSYTTAATELPPGLAMPSALCPLEWRVGTSIAHETRSDTRRTAST